VIAGVGYILVGSDKLEAGNQGRYSEKIAGRSSGIKNKFKSMEVSGARKKDAAKNSKTAFACHAVSKRESRDERKGEKN